MASKTPSGKQKNYTIFSLVDREKVLSLPDITTLNGETEESKYEIHFRTQASKCRA